MPDWKKVEVLIIYDYLVLLSGPEPQRSMLEDILLKELNNSRFKVLFIRGIISEETTIIIIPNVKIKNYLFGNSLEIAINSSRCIISRSGYTTMMDLSKLQKKAFFIPTPGQNEQEYLARKMANSGFAPYCEQHEFSLGKLNEIDKYRRIT